MRTIWNDPYKGRLNYEIHRVGDIYEQHKFKKADKETLNTIRKETAHGLHDSYLLLKMYLETKGLTINENTKEIIKQN